MLSRIWAQALNAPLLRNVPPATVNTLRMALAQHGDSGIDALPANVRVLAQAALREVFR